MEGNTNDLMSLLKPGSKLRTLLAGIPAGAKYAAVTLPLAAATTKLALDSYDDVADKFARTRLRRQMRQEALKKLAYDALKGDETKLLSILGSQAGSSGSSYSRPIEASTPSRPVSKSLFGDDDDLDITDDETEEEMSERMRREVEEEEEQIRARRHQPYNYRGA